MVVKKVSSSNKQVKKTVSKKTTTPKKITPKKIIPKKITPKKTTSYKPVIVKQKEYKSYLDYIKQHKYAFLTGGGLVTLIGTGLTLYVRFNRKKVINGANKQVDKIINNLNEIKNDPKIKNDISDIGSQTIIKVVNKYKNDIVNAVGDNFDKLKNVASNTTNNIVNTVGDKLKNIPNIFDSIQNGIASIVVPPLINNIPDLKEEIQNAVVISIEENVLDKEKIKIIEDYLINNKGINKNCTLNFKEKNIISGGFDGKCLPDDEKKIYEQVLKYYSDLDLYRDIEMHLDPSTLKKAEEYLINKTGLNKNCTKNFYSYIYGPACSNKDKEEADKIIAYTFDLIKNGKTLN